MSTRGKKRVEWDGNMQEQPWQAEREKRESNGLKLKLRTDEK